MSKKFLFFPLLIGVLFIFTNQAKAQSQDPLIKKYRQMAVEYQQEIKIAEGRLHNAVNELDRSKTDFLPKFDLQGNYNYYGVPLSLGATDPDVPSPELHHFYTVNLVLTQPIFMGGSITNTKNAAASKVDFMQSLVNMKQQDIMSKSDAYYWQAVTKNELYMLSQAYRDNIGKFLKVIQDRVDEEVAGMNELYQTKVRYNDAQYAVIRAKKELRVSMMNLNRLIGVPIDTTVEIADTLIIVKWQQPDTSIVEKALSQRPEVQYYANKIRMNEYNEKVVAANYNPKIYIQGIGKWGSPSPGLQPEPDFNYQLSANVAIPIFYWGRRAYDVGTRQAKTEISRYQLDNAKEDIKLEVQSAYYELERTQEQLDFAASSLENAKKNVDVYLDRYNEGLSSVLEVLDAQLYWEKTYLNYIEAKYQLNMAYSAYQRALGDLTVK